MANKKPTLLIDQDDVLAEYISGVTTAFNEKYKTSFLPRDCKSWDLCSVFGNTVETVMHEPQLFRDLKPTENALEVFERLYSSELFEMYIVTAANPRAVEAKYEWIKEHLPFFPQNRIMICSCKYMVKGDYLLDDGMHNIEAFHEAGGTPIVFQRPHNVELTHPFVEVKGWLAFERFIINTCYKDIAEEYFSVDDQVVV